MCRKVWEPLPLVYSPVLGTGGGRVSVPFFFLFQVSLFSIFLKWTRTMYQAVVLSLAQHFPNFDMD